MSFVQTSSPIAKPLNALVQTMILIRCGESPFCEPQEDDRHDEQSDSQGRPEVAHLDRPQTQQLTRKDRKQRRQGAGAESVTCRSRDQQQDDALFGHDKGQSLRKIVP